MLRPGQVIALCAIALLTIGVLMVSSAKMRVGPVDSADDHLPTVTASSVLLSRSATYMVLAIGAMAVGASTPVRRLAAVGAAGPAWGLRLLAVGAGVLLVVCALVYVPGISRNINGSHRWIGLPVPGLGDALSVQPSEIAKWAMIGLIAMYCASRASLIREFWRGLVPAMAAIGLVSGFIVLADLGTGVLIAGVACLMLLAGGARLRYFAMPLPLGILGIAGAIVTSPYRMKRVLAFMDPYADPQGIGYHTIQSLVAVAGGHGWGRGLGHGLQKFDYLPESSTDFIFAIICEELGIAGAGLVMALFATLVWAGYSIMRRERDPVLKLVSLGIIATIGLQAIINLAVVTGLAPTKGIALPLLSSGGTGWILTAFSLGVLVAVDRTQAAVAAVGGMVEGKATIAASPVIEAAEPIVA